MCPHVVPLKNRRIALIGAVSLVGLLEACTMQRMGTVPMVPDNLRVPPTEKLALEACAVGVQIYDCKPTGSPARFEWVFRAPEAELFDTNGKKIGKHYAGPTWELNDGSKVVGEVKAREDGPDTNAIPWLLLTVKSSSGSGELANAASVQRVQTVGGKAPAGGCNEGQAGKDVRVPYSATYYFYVRT